MVPLDLVVIDRRPKALRYGQSRVWSGTTQAGAAIPSLTGIRGAAALWVLLHHFEASICDALGLARDDLGSLTRQGFRGVDLFFVLSGFILMHIHAREFLTPTRDVTKRFYLLRFMRVYPLNAAVLLALLAVVPFIPDFVAWEREGSGSRSPEMHVDDFSAAGFVQSLLLAQTWTVAKLGEWNGPAWTLSAEVFGYLLFPAIAFVLARQRSAWLCAWLAVASLALLTALIVIFGHVHNNPSGLFGLARMLFSFFAGICLARCYRIWPWPAAAGPVIAAASLAVIAVIAVVEDLPGFAASPLAMVFAFAGLILGLAFRRGAVNALFASPPLLFLGKISFSLYLVHYVPSRLYWWVVERSADGIDQTTRLVLLAATLTAAFLGALAAYYLVEQPCQRLGRRLAGRGSEGPRR